MVPVRFFSAVLAWRLAATQPGCTQPNATCLATGGLYDPSAIAAHRCETTNCRSSGYTSLCGLRGIDLINSVSALPCLAELGCDASVNLNTQRACEDGLEWDYNLQIWVANEWTPYTCGQLASSTPSVECQAAFDESLRLGYSCCASPPPPLEPRRNESADEPCFPSSSRVSLANGTSARLDALVPGDSILVATADGALVTDTLSPLSIAEPQAHADFLTIRTAAGTSLSVTAEHHVAVGPACCATLKQARELRVGETVHQLVAGVVTAATVAKVGVVVAAGRHSPVTTHAHYPIVDGFVTAFDSSARVRLASFALPLLEVTGATDLFRRTFLKPGRRYVDGTTTQPARTPPTTYNERRAEEEGTRQDVFATENAGRGHAPRAATDVA